MSNNYIVNYPREAIEIARSLGFDTYVPVYSKEISLDFKGYSYLEDTDLYNELTNIDSKLRRINANGNQVQISSQPPPPYTQNQSPTQQSSGLGNSFAQGALNVGKVVGTGALNAGLKVGSSALNVGADLLSRAIAPRESRKGKESAPVEAEEEVEEEEEDTQEMEEVTPTTRPSSARTSLRLFDSKLNLVRGINIDLVGAGVLANADIPIGNQILDRWPVSGITKDSDYNFVNIMMKWIMNPVFVNSENKIPAMSGGTKVENLEPALFDLDKNTGLLVLRKMPLFKDFVSRFKAYKPKPNGEGYTTKYLPPSEKLGDLKGYKLTYTPKLIPKPSDSATKFQKDQYIAQQRVLAGEPLITGAGKRKSRASAKKGKSSKRSRKARK